MRVLVVGATGVLGQRTVPELVRAGHNVAGLARNDGRAQTVRSLGATAVIGDLFDPGSLEVAARSCDAVVHLATRIPHGVRTTVAAWRENDRVRVTGTKNLLDAARSAGCGYYLQQSVTFIYGEHGDAWIDEATPIPPQQPAILRSAVEMERLVRDSRLPHGILRAGTFYGRGTGMTEGLLDLVKRGRLPVAGDGRAFTSLIHVEDIGRMVAAAADRRLEGTFNVVDEEPVRQAELIGYAAALAGSRPPRHVPLWFTRTLGGAAAAVVLQSQRVSGSRLRAELGLPFRYPTYREGLRDAWNRETPPDSTKANAV